MKMRTNPVLVAGSWAYALLLDVLALLAPAYGGTPASKTIVQVNGTWILVLPVVLAALSSYPAPKKLRVARIVGIAACGAILCAVASTIATVGVFVSPFLVIAIVRVLTLSERDEHRDSAEALAP